MRRKILRILVIIVIIASFSNTNIVQAENLIEKDITELGVIGVTTGSGSSSSSTSGGIGDVIKGGDDFISEGQRGDTSIDKEQLQNASSAIYNVLLIVGIIAAVLVSGILGIKFMLGSVEEKAEVKAALIPFVIGCIVVFGAFGIWKIVVTIGNRL